MPCGAADTPHGAADASHGAAGNVFTAFLGAKSAQKWSSIKK